MDVFKWFRSITNHSIMIIFHVIFFSVFIAVFFFTYSANIERQMIEIQARNVVFVICDDFSVISPNITKMILRSLVSDSLQSPDLSEDDRLEEEKNRKLIDKSVSFLLSIFVIGLFLNIFLAVIYRINIVWHISKSVVSLAFFALTEFLFFLFVVQNYIIADPNVVKLVIVKTLKQYMESPDEEVKE